MTAIAERLRYRPLLWQASSATTNARKTRAGIARATDHVREVASDWRPVVFAASAEIHAECSVPNWDGNDALAVSPDTIAKAAQIADILFLYVPRGTPAPELVPEPDGEISLSWTISPTRLFSVSVGAHKTLNYAGHLPSGAEPHGFERFDPDNLSSLERIASYLKQLYS